jgi:hypothetical protein
MSKFLYPFALLMLLSGCVTVNKPIPDGYTGPTANIKDSLKYHSSRKTDFFFLQAIDDRTIPDSLIATRMKSYGKGSAMTLVLIDRNVPAQMADFKIVGRTEYAAPILALTGTVYQVEGKVHFSPEDGKTYVVKGELGEKYSAVWIEDANSHEVVGEKIEVKGSAALGFSDK